jgi:hypothetical protein
LLSAADNAFLQLERMRRCRLRSNRATTNAFKDYRKSTCESDKVVLGALTVSAALSRRRQQLEKRGRDFTRALAGHEVPHAWHDAPRDQLCEHRALGRWGLGGRSGDPVFRAVERDRRCVDPRP